MSGMEVVGVVFGAASLLIAAAEHSRKAADAFSQGIRKDEILVRYFVDLELEMHFLQTTIADFLTRLRSGQRYRTLDDVDWEDPDLSDRAKAALGRYYDHFTFRLKSIHSEMEQQVIKYEGQIPSTQENASILTILTRTVRGGSTTATSKRRELCERIVFVWNRSGRKASLDSIQQDRIKLVEMLSTANLSSPVPRRNGSGSSSPFQETFQLRNHAVQVHKVLRGCCKPSCCPSHEAKLKLRLPPIESSTAFESGINFETLLLGLCSARIHVERGGHAVLLAERGPYTPIEDICKTIRSAHASKPQMNLIIRDQALFGDVVAGRDESGRKTVGLCDYLAVFPCRDERKRWLLRQRAKLAVLLAHAVLQLRQSPWLEETWSKSQIFFLRDDQPEAGGRQRFRLDDPYVSAALATRAYDGGDDDVEMEGCETETSYDSGSFIEAIVRADHAVPSVLALGIVLLEIYLGIDLEKVWKEDKTVNVYALAWRMWQGRLHTDQDVSDETLGAIGWCITLSPLAPGRLRGFQHLSFCQQFKEQVVEPLESDLSEYGIDPRSL